MLVSLPLPKHRIGPGPSMPKVRASLCGPMNHGHWKVIFSNSPNLAKVFLGLGIRVDVPVEADTGGKHAALPLRVGLPGDGAAGGTAAGVADVAGAGDEVTVAVVDAVLIELSELVI